MRKVALLALFSALLVGGCGGEDTGTVDGADATEKQSASEPATDESEPPRVDPVLPEGGTVPKVQSLPLKEAARSAGCELESFEANSREHTSNPDEEIDPSSAPPTSGKHFEAPAEDGAYLKAPPETALVHSLEHGRVVIWFKGVLPSRARANLRAFYEDDPRQTILTPDETGSEYVVSATAWNRAPEPNGTGRLLGCRTFSPRVFAALEAFQAKHRGRGPETIP